MKAAVVNKALEEPLAKFVVPFWGGYFPICIKDKRQLICIRAAADPSVPMYDTTRNVDFLHSRAMLDMLQIANPLMNSNNSFPDG